MLNVIRCFLGSEVLCVLEIVDFLCFGIYLLILVNPFDHSLLLNGLHMGLHFLQTFPAFSKLISRSKK
jgi:hypothetical protein